ncbi:MAG TPA: HAMP domain-containing sensor histidine kinase [Patescibacteria group bacterium]|nr:HAMP domain-containing sensor histidine kinase [Patescibacteria group bacterium]
MTAAGPGPDPGRAPSAVRTSSIQVALVTTGIVGVAYLVVCIAVLAIVSSGLTREIDRRLADTLVHIGHEPPPDHGYDAPPGGPRFGSPLLVWTVRADGSVSSNTTDAELPEGYLSSTGPATVTIGDEQIRIQGEPTPTGFVVVGQTTAAVDQARTTLLLAELIIAPILLLIVFLGAVAIGRRVAAPIEQARVRQLEFTADASHELRTPLSVIEAHTSLALAQPRQPDWYRSAFGKIDVESKRMRRLVEDLLWLARFDATREPPDAQPVDVGVLAGETVDRFRIVAEARGLRLDLQTDDGTHIVHVPPEWLDRLLGVLLDNACKYAPAGSTVVVAVKTDAGRVRLTVDDAGPGIPEDQRARIFDRFHRATDATGGAGLGLAIADAIVRTSGGRWRVGESPAGGASLSVAWKRETA